MSYQFGVWAEIPQCGYTEHGLKDLAFYVQKHIASRAMCHNFLLVRDKPLGAPAFVRLVYWSSLPKEYELCNQTRMVLSVHHGVELPTLHTYENPTDLPITRL